MEEVQDCETEKIECKKTMVIFGDNGAMLVPKVVRKLDQSNIKLEKLVVSPPSLDDVFLKFTGRKLRVESSGPSRKRRWGS